MSVHLIVHVLIQLREGLVLLSTKYLILFHLLRKEPVEEFTLLCKVGLKISFDSLKMFKLLGPLGLVDCKLAAILDLFTALLYALQLLQEGTGVFLLLLEGYLLPSHAPL
jgi:hypothetical protein